MQGLRRNLILWAYDFFNCAQPCQCSIRWWCLIMSFSLTIHLPEDASERCTMKRTQDALKVIYSCTGDRLRTIFGCSKDNIGDVFPSRLEVMSSSNADHVFQMATIIWSSAQQCMLYVHIQGFGTQKSNRVSPAEISSEIMLSTHTAKIWWWPFYVPKNSMIIIWFSDWVKRIGFTDPFR